METKTKEALACFLKHNDRVLICCSRKSPNGIAMERAVSEYGGIPMFWFEDYRWSALLRRVFTGRHRVLAGPPMLLLGLSKLSKQLGTPLNIRHVLLIGPCEDWVRNAIEQGLDCKIWPIPLDHPRLSQEDELRELKLQILRWSSVLDCRIVKGTYGLEIQAVIFPGKKLPQFPTCAKLDAQPYNRERHIPYYIAYHPKNPGIYQENH